MLLTLSLTTGCNEPTGNGMLSVSQDTESSLNDIGIAAIPTPAGWLPNRSGGNTAVIFLRKDATPNNPEEMISIDIGAPSSDNVKQSADSLAKKFGGQVADLSFTIDGETAYKVSVPPNHEQLTPRECVVTHHNNQVCIVFGASKSQNDIWPTVLTIAESLKWN